MSVYRALRSIPSVGYLRDAYELRQQSIMVVKKFPTNLRYVFSNNLMDLTNEVFTNCMKANSITFHKNLPQVDFDLRHSYFMQAASACNALSAEITFAYEFVDQGNNYFDGKADYDKKFENWIKSVEKAMASITRAMKNDKRKYKKAHRVKPAHDSNS